MKLIARLALLSVAAIPFAMLASADPQDQSRVVLDTSGKTPVYRVTVVERTTKAINYRHRSGPTEVDFRGTNLMPEARGKLNINSKQGRIEIKARMEKAHSRHPVRPGVSHLRPVGRERGRPPQKFG